MRRAFVAAIASAAVTVPALTVPAGIALAACPDAAAIERFVADYRALTPTRSFGPGLSIADGLCAQKAIVAALGSDLGRPVGYKVGLTNKATQDRFKVPHPVRGVLLERMLVKSGARVAVPYGSIPLMDADLLVRVRDDGINTATTDAELLRSLSAVVPFIELPDLAFAQGELMDGGNLTAINVAARLGVVGDDIPVDTTADFARALAAMTIRMSDDTGKVLAESTGAAVLDHPLNVVRWLVADLKANGLALKPGEIVSLGSFSPLLPAVPAIGRTVTVEYSGLPGGARSVSVVLAAKGS